MNFKYYDYEESYFVYADGLCDLERHKFTSGLRFCPSESGAGEGQGKLLEGFLSIVGKELFTIIQVRSGR